MEALRIISDEHKNFWRIAVTLEHVADEIDQGTALIPPFSPLFSTTSKTLPTTPTI